MLLRLPQRAIVRAVTTIDAARHPADRCLRRLLDLIAIRAMATSPWGSAATARWLLEQLASQ